MNVYFPTGAEIQQQTDKERTTQIKYKKKKIFSCWGDAEWKTYTDS